MKTKGEDGEWAIESRCGRGMRQGLGEGKEKKNVFYVEAVASVSPGQLVERLKPLLQHVNGKRMEKNTPQQPHPMVLSYK